ncbi:hypothetical protein MMC16_004493 [Acarospora aff. strigata]|nr:hypothetical protein [Acarospora aff. strigata]
MALNISDGSSNFTQQGSLDWVQLANTTFGASVAVLGRLSASGVDPLTLVVGQAVSSKLKFSLTGLNRLQDALHQLKSFSTMGDLVWIGFGVKLIIRKLSETMNGLKCIMLCACISEVHSPDAGGMIMSELAHLYGAPEDLLPSPLQWKTLVESCSGIFRSTNFGCVAEQFMSYSEKGRLCDRKGGDPRNVAEALDAIGCISSGSLTSITLRGGPACGWIAAVGLWFLGLEVEIRAPDGSTLYTSTQDKPIHMTVIYGSAGASGTEIASKEYIVLNIIDFVHDRDFYENTISGTVSWESCIKQTFGIVGEQLLGATNEVGSLIGYAARVFQGCATAGLYAKIAGSMITKSSNGKSFTSHRRWYGYNDGQYGRGFLQSAISWFPELGCMQIIMETGYNVSYENAICHYKDILLSLSRRCPCKVCTGSQKNPVSDEFCLPILAEVVIILVWNFSSLSLSVPLNPTRVGLESVLMFYKLNRFESVSFGDIARLFRFLDMGSIVAIARCVFSGGGLDIFDAVVVAAASHRGVCYYMDILLEVSDQPQKVTLLHVLPGCIESKKGRRISRIVDHTHLYDPTMNYSADNYTPLRSLSDEIYSDTGSKDLRVTLILKETMSGFSVAFRFSNSEGMCEVGPYAILHGMIRSLGLAVCPGHNCQTLQPPFQNQQWLHQTGSKGFSIYTLDGEGIIPEPEGETPVKGETAVESDVPRMKHRRQTVVIRRLHNNTLARCIAVSDFRRYKVPAVLRRDECISCCIKAALSLDEPTTYIIL